MEVRWSPAALNDLREVEVQSQVHAAAILARSVQLELFPESGRMVPEYQSRIIRELIERPYRVIYELFPDRVEVIAVIHGARDIRPD